MEFVEKEQFYHFPWMIDTFLPTQKQIWCLSSRKCYVVIRTDFDHEWLQEIQEVTGILDNGPGITGQAEG